MRFGHPAAGAGVLFGDPGHTWSDGFYILTIQVTSGVLFGNPVALQEIYLILKGKF